MVRSLALVLVAACSSPATPPDAPNAPWFAGPELPGKRLEPGVTALGQRLVVLGGFYQNQIEGLGITSKVIALDQLTGTWSELHDAPVQWTHINLASTSATLYLLGGEETAQFLPRGEAYALDTDLPAPQWRQLQSMPAGMERGAAGVIVSPPHIYLIGGASTTDAVKTCLDYDLSKDTWAMLPDLPAPRSHPAVMRRSDGTLIVAGGLATLDATSAVADVWVLPPGGTAWEPRAAMPTPRGGCAYGVVLGQLVCAGGEAPSIIAGQGQAMKVVESYDPIADVWTKRDDMPEGTAGTQGAVIAGRLYVPGGSRSLRFEPESTLYVFSLLDGT